MSTTVDSLAHLAVAARTTYALIALQEAHFSAETRSGPNHHRIHFGVPRYSMLQFDGELNVDAKKAFELGKGKVPGRFAVELVLA